MNFISVLPASISLPLPLDFNSPRHRTLILCQLWWGAVVLMTNKVWSVSEVNNGEKNWNKLGERIPAPDFPSLACQSVCLALFKIELSHFGVLAALLWNANLSIQFLCILTCCSEGIWFFFLPTVIYNHAHLYNSLEYFFLNPFPRCRLVSFLFRRDFFIPCKFILYNCFFFYGNFCEHWFSLELFTHLVCSISAAFSPNYIVLF